MLTYSNDELNLKTSIVSIGAFDGLHRGHQTLLRKSANRARELNIPSVVYTFNPLPRAFFQNSIMLTTLDEKIELIRQCDIDYLVIADFNQQYASRTASSFIEELHTLGPDEIFVGPNFTFGKGKEGTINMLREQFTVNVHPLVTCDEGEIISSTRIRRLVKDDNLVLANRLLGRRCFDESTMSRKKEQIIN